MQRVYLITSKLFYTDLAGVDQQFADYGCMPSMFSSLKKAKKCLRGYLDQRFDVFKEELKEEYPKGRNGEPRLVEEYVTISPITGVRNIISLWREWIY